MQIVMRWAVLLSLVCVSTGCTQWNSTPYVPPQGVTSETGARLRGSVHPDSGFIFNRLVIDVHTVDGGTTAPSIPGGSAGLFADSVLLSAAEDHEIEFCIFQSKPDISTNETKGGCGVITAKLDAGKSYLLRSTWTGRHTNRCESVWIENRETGEIASSKVGVEIRDHLNWKHGRDGDRCRATE